MEQQIKHIDIIYVRWLYIYITYIYIYIYIHILDSHRTYICANKLVASRTRKACSTKQRSKKHFLWPPWSLCSSDNDIHFDLSYVGWLYIYHIYIYIYSYTRLASHIYMCEQAPCEQNMKSLFDEAALKKHFLWPPWPLCSSDNEINFDLSYTQGQISPRPLATSVSRQVRTWRALAF